MRNLFNFKKRRSGNRLFKNWKFILSRYKNNSTRDGTLSLFSKIKYLKYQLPWVKNKVPIYNSGQSKVPCVKVHERSFEPS
jgi:hypothetical protein